ncbi:Cyclin-dependent kinase-like 5 [Mortierella sp. GBA35]|nr:Cyclin-dependent kinase-like 5 [Mortierella sp. GBA35]
MLNTRTGPGQPTSNIGLLLTVVSALVVTVSALPGDAVSLNPTTVTSCLSATGAWTVGADKDNRLTFAHSSGMTHRPRTALLNSDFLGGYCLELNPTTVFFISDWATGNMTISPTGAPTWQEDSFPKNKNKNFINPSDFTKKNTAIGSGVTPGVVTLITIPSNTNNIVRWNAGTSPATGIALLSDLPLTAPNEKAITASEIMAMALSGDSLYILYNIASPRLYRLRISGDPGPKHDFFNVPPPGNRALVPMSDNTGVALVNMASLPNTVELVYCRPAGCDTNPTIYPIGAPLAAGMLIVDSGKVTVVTKEGLINSGISSQDGSKTGGQPGGDATPVGPQEAPSTEKPASKSANHLPAIIGGVVGGLALAVIAAFLIIRRKKTRGGNTTSRSLFAKKQQDLFPPKADDTLVPLGLYNQERSLPPRPRDQDDDLERMGYMPHQGMGTHMRSADTERASFLSHHDRSSAQASVDETIPVEAALTHRRHDQLTPQGLHHSISVSSVTSRFPRQSAKNGKLFEEKIQLQVIRYEVPDAHLMAPHGTIGRLVLGTYHIISDPKSARSVKPQGGNIQGLARSGTVVVRKSRASMISGHNSPLVEMAEESSMLLTDAENQHTFEGATLKWYMTEIHWKREAALLKRLKSPIFIMELLESYCIPALQNRAFTYPFVNAMGGRSSLLSDLSPVRTAQHTRAILRSISAAVEWCHRHGVVHLNIQPGSFFLEDDIDPRTEDASWKLWDFTCARYIGERIGPFGGSGESADPSRYQPPSNPSNPDSFPYMDQQQHDRQMDRIGGNPLPAAYTAPELLEAWRAGEVNFPVEANMDTWSLGCLYYEILTGTPLFPTEAEAWSLVGGWENNGLWSAKNFLVPYPPSPSARGVAPATNESKSNSPYERSQTLDPSGSIAKLLRDMMSPQPEERVSLETIMERIY